LVGGGGGAPKHGGIERTMMYHTSHEQSSREHLHQGGGFGFDAKNQWDV